MKQHSKLILNIVSVTIAVAAMALTAGAQYSCTKSVSKSGENMSVRELKVAFPYVKSIREFDPQNIQTNAEANLARNLFSRLIEFDKNGNIQPSLAADVFVENGTVILKIREDVKTISGQPIGAVDVVHTLERIISEDKNTHGSLRNLLGMESGDGSSPYIWRDGSTVYLKPKVAASTEFIVPLLASTDFSIVPIRSLNKGSGPIVTDFRNTSGVYFVKEDAENGGYLLEANPNHYYYSSDIPQRIRLVPAYGEAALELFEKGEVDFITTINGGASDKYYQVAEKRIGATVKTTKDIKLTILKTTENGRARHSSKERLYIGLKVRQVLLAQDGKDKHSREAQQLFPNLGEGMLTEQQLAKLNEKRDSLLGTEMTPKNDFILAVGPRDMEKMKEVYRSLPFIKVVGSAAPPWILPKDKQPDGYVNSTDSSFYESLSLLNYNFSTEAFGAKSKGDQWIQKYTAIADKTKRIEMLRELHLYLLENGYVTPISFSPYLSLSRRNLDFGISKFYAGTKLWELKIQ